MGNNQKPSNQMSLKVKRENIIIHKSYKMNLSISSLVTFPHGLDGLKLWEAGIVLSRYIINHSSLFKNKRVLELGAGVGIAGITAKKWTECREVQMTDYDSQVIDNIKKNMQNNATICPVFPLDWRKHGTDSNPYDIIMGSDIVYFGCPVEELYQVFKEKLDKNGIGIIVIPIRKNYAELFSKQIQPSIFQVQIQKLTKQQYFQSPLQNQQSGFKQYPLLKQIGFEVYKITKK